MADTMLNTQQRHSGRFVLLCFVCFFGVIIAVNTVFITAALNSHSGVVTEQPYEKGLAFNDVLAKAKSQPNLDNHVSYQDGFLRWTLPNENASVTATMIRPVKEGHDFDITLKHVGNGTYQARPDLPLSGTWTALLKATWGDEQFQVSHTLLAL